MKRISIMFLLIVYSLMGVSGNYSLRKSIPFKNLERWGAHGKSASLIPVEAYLENNNLVMCLVSREMEIITIVIKDSKGNIVFQDNINPNIQDFYILQLENYPIGCYDLFVSDEDSEFSGHFDI